MLLIRQVMNRNVVAISPEATLKEASKVMAEAKIGSLVVVENDKLVGIITNSDVTKAIALGKDPEFTLVKEIMSSPVITINPEKSLEDAVNLMMEKRIKRLVVVENKKIVGIITASDIIVVEPKMVKMLAGLISLRVPGYTGG